jgi:hypothetical protein
MAVTCVLKAMRGRIALQKFRETQPVRSEFRAKRFGVQGALAPLLGLRDPLTLYSQASVNKARVSSTPVRQISIIS